MAKNYFYITLSLAGICQCVRLIQQLAYQNQCDEQYLRIALQSLLDLNPESVYAVYGDKTSHLHMGLETLQAVLNTRSRKGLSAELIRYILGLIILERKLHNSINAQRSLNLRINKLHSRLNYLDLLSDKFISDIASIYVDIISPLGPKIQITGVLTILQNTYIQAKVRALLLAGIRSAVLWRQVGGKWLQLILSRKQLFKEAKQIVINS